MVSVVGVVVVVDVNANGCEWDCGPGYRRSYPFIRGSKRVRDENRGANKLNVGTLPERDGEGPLTGCCADADADADADKKKSR